MKTKIFKSGFGEKLKLLLIPIGLLIGSLTTQVWGWSATWRCVPALAFGNWWDESTKNIRLTIRVKTSGEGDHYWTISGFTWNGLMYESGGNLYKIYEASNGSLPFDGCQEVMFMLYKGDDHEKNASKYDSWESCSFWSDELYTNQWTSYSHKAWNIPSGTTIVWDGGNQSWPAAQIYYAKKGYTSADDLTQLGSTQQFYKTYSGAWEGYGMLKFRQNSSWTAKSTNINTDVSSSSGIVLFTHCNNSYTGGEADWQKVSPAYKASDGATIYFDNTDANYSDPYVKWGSDWYNRAGDMDVVPGTNGKLYKYTFPHDVYYGEYLVSDGYGYTNDYYCTEDHCTYYTSLQNANISSATTLIPSAKSAGASTTILNGYERTVTISSYSHGTVHVTYTDANNAAQDKTTGNFNVQQACVITVTATADEGYRLTGLTVGGAAFTSGNTYPVRDGITIAATFTPNTYSIRFNANYPDGATGTSGSMSNEAFTYGTAKALTANAFSCDHYNFAGWATTADGSKAYDDKQSVNNLTATHEGVVDLFAKWGEITHTVSFANDGHGTTTPNTNQTVGEVTGVAINASNSTGYSFNTWTITSGSGSFASSASTASNTFKPTSDATLTASFNAITYNGVIDSNGGTSDGAYSVTFNDNKIDVTTPPTYAGYEVEEYHFTDDLNMKIANKDESLVSNFSHDAVTYISGGKWVKDGAIRLYPKWGPITYTIALDDNFPEGTTTTPGSVNFTAKYGTSNYSAITYPTANGYKFVGYFTNDITPIQVIKENHSKNTETARDYIDEDGHWVNTSTTITLYAHWTPVALSFTNEGGDGSWTNTANWSPACVPTSSHNVTINAETKITGSAVADTVTIAEGGKVIIEATGVLEVGSTVINTNSDKLVINTTTSSQGALIFDITKTSPSATVNMSIPSGGFHLIASPTGGAKVSSTFSGSGIYTYAWEEGKGWDRRGYYDDFTGNEAILIFGQTSCSFSGILSKACGGSARYSTGEGVETSAQGVNMIANPLTAPIKIAAMTISGSKDGAVHLYNGSWVGKTPALAGDAVIPAMQGYGVIATSGGGSVSFTYNTAVRGASSKNAPLNAPKRTDSDILDHITLSVTTNDRKVDLNLYENEQFTERIDVGWEAIYMEGDGRFGELYAIADEKMNILATPDLEGTVLGFVPGQAASYTISFEGDGKGYYLNDLDMQESTLIEEGNTYVFTPNESTNSTRFVISKTPIHKTTTGNDAIYDGVKARKQMIDGILYIIRDGRMYDATGVLVK